MATTLAAVVFSGCATINNSVGNKAEELGSWFEKTTINMGLGSVTMLNNFPRWDGSGNYNLDALYKEAGESDSSPLSALNSYFMQAEKKAMEQAFDRQHPRPVPSRFRTDQENFREVDAYNDKVSDLYDRWEYNLPTTRKTALTKTLNAYYGNPEIADFDYNANTTTMYVSIKSRTNDFKRMLKIEEVQGSTAEAISKNLYTLRPVFYFDSKENALELLGATVVIEGKVTMADMTDEWVDRENTPVFSYKDHALTFDDKRIGYISEKNRAPDWYDVRGVVEEDGLYKGFGQAQSKEEAIESARSAIAKSIYVNVMAEHSSDTTLKDGEVRRDIRSKVRSETNVKLDNAIPEKVEPRGVGPDRLWYAMVAYEHVANRP